MLCESDKQSIFADSDYDDMRALLGKRSFMRLVDVFRSSSKADFSFFFGKWGVFSEQLQSLNESCRPYSGLYASCLKLIFSGSMNVSLRKLLDPSISYQAALAVPFPEATAQQRRKAIKYYQTVQRVMEKRKALGLPQTIPSTADLYSTVKPLYRMVLNKTVQDLLDSPGDIDASRARGELVENQYGGELMVHPPEPEPGDEPVAYVPESLVRRVGFLQRMLEASPGNAFCCTSPPSSQDVSQIKTVLRMAVRYARRYDALQRCTEALSRFDRDQHDVLHDIGQPRLPQLSLLKVMLSDLLLQSPRMDEKPLVNAAIACIEQAQTLANKPALKAIYQKMIERFESIARQAGCFIADKEKRYSYVPKPLARSLQALLKHVEHIKPAGFNKDAARWLLHFETRFIHAALIEVLQHIGYKRLDGNYRQALEKLCHRVADEKAMAALLCQLPSQLITPHLVESLANVSAVILQQSSYTAQCALLLQRLADLPQSLSLVNKMHWTWLSSAAAINKMLSKTNAQITAVAVSRRCYGHELPMVNLSRYRLHGSFPLSKTTEMDEAVSSAPRPS